MALVLAVLCALFWVAPPVAARTLVWTGNGPDALWSDPSNWYVQISGTNGVPRNGDDLDFDEFGFLGGPPPMQNDLTDLAVNSMYFAISDLTTEDWVLNGNPAGEAERFYRLFKP